MCGTLCGTRVTFSLTSPLSKLTIFAPCLAPHVAPWHLGMMRITSLQAFLDTIIVDVRQGDPLRESLVQSLYQNLVCGSVNRNWCGEFWYWHSMVQMCGAVIMPVCGSVNRNWCGMVWTGMIWDMHALLQGGGGFDCGDQKAICQIILRATQSTSTVSQAALASQTHCSVWFSMVSGLADDEYGSVADECGTQCAHMWQMSTSVVHCEHTCGRWARVWYTESTWTAKPGRWVLHLTSKRQCYPSLWIVYTVNTRLHISIARCKCLLDSWLYHQCINERGGHTRINFILISYPVT